MSELVPDKPRIERATVERIIRRAAELQAGDHDIGDGLTERELMDLGQEVGIPPGLLQQALLEERTRAVATAEQGITEWLTGPTRVAVQRTISGDGDRIQAALHHWMTDAELLTMKRRYPDRTSWEARQDMFSSLKREFKMGGRPYRLAHSREIVGQVAPLEPGRSHVRLLADMSNTRQSHLVGAATVAGAGGIATAIGITLGVALPVAMIPLGLGLLTGFAVARRRRGQVEQVQTAMEQVLDRLEHGEISPPSPSDESRPSTLERLAREIRKNLGV
ncbi:MAG: hypothetical protein V3T20_07755 [Gemmatimonadota bacterium]